MRVPAKARRSVIFIGDRSEHGRFRPRATGFLALTAESGEQNHHPYLVTAEHVISGLATKQREIFCRLNLKNGTVATESMADAHWYYHPNETTDVAVTPFGINKDLVDHDWMPLPHPDWKKTYPYRFGTTIGFGDEVFIVGLFRSHHGEERNIPIIRIGNIAALPEEPIQTKFCGPIDAYLIEARSIAGLSGSPVFVNPSPDAWPMSSGFRNSGGKAQSLEDPV